MLFPALSKEDVIAAIEGTADPTVRVPMLLHFWVHSEEFGERTSAVLDLLSRYPQDIQRIQLASPKVFETPMDDPNYRWMDVDDPYIGQSVGLDERIAIRDWAQWESVLAQWPNAEYTGLIPGDIPDNGLYRVAVCWNCLFERHWSLRGMTNALTDFYTDPDKVHALYRAFTDFYLRMIERVREEGQADAIFFSDDIGQQQGPFFSLEMFRSFFRPYYQEMIDKAHDLGMHFWLHSCGDIESFLPDFIDIGLDVIHPIQKYTMEEKRIADRFGADICIWAGFDVQQVIPWGTPEEVRQELRFMLETYRRPEGRLLIGAGNGVNGDCPLASLEALFDEAFI